MGACFRVATAGAPLRGCREEVVQCVIIEIVAIVQELRFRPCCTVHVVRSFAKDADRGLLQVRRMFWTGGRCKQTEKARLALYNPCRFPH